MFWIRKIFIFIFQHFNLDLFIYLFIFRFLNDQVTQKTGVMKIKLCLHRNKLDFKIY